MADSPIRAVLRAIDALDADAAVAGFAPTGTLTMVFSQTASGIDEVRSALAGLIAELRATHHDVTAEWNPEPGVWIAEMMATYELQDFGQLGPYRRAMVLRQGPEGIVELAVYGTHEPRLSQSERHYQEVYAGGRWLPTL